MADLSKRNRETAYSTGFRDAFSPYPSLQISEGSPCATSSLQAGVCKDGGSQEEDSQARASEALEER